MVLLGTCLALSACASETDTKDSETASDPAPAPEAKARSEVQAAESSAGKTADQAADGADEEHTAAQAEKVLPKLDAKTPYKDVPAECRGLQVEGMKQSPGGSTLPNKCAPFHGTYNNPYAIRCMDADPSFKTKYAGDDFCILPPPDELGTQVHIAPDDMSKPGTYELAPGQEENTMYYLNAPNSGDHYYYRTNWRMRGGSHHMIITVSDDDRADGWASDLQGADAKNVGNAGFDMSGKSRSFGGAQRPDQDRPQGTLDVPPENLGIGAQITNKQQFSFNLHHINTSSEPILREVWVNVWYMDEKDVTRKMQGLAAAGSPKDVSIPAHKRTVLNYQCNVEADSRIITMNGHRHAHTDRFSVWVKKQSGDMVNAYESFNWEDMPTFQYDSVSSNPAANVKAKQDGASSGMLEVQAGDEVHFKCDINNTLDVPLKFANEAIDGEMCILFGTYVGDKSPCSAGAQRLPDGDEDGH
jgi:hypothetical protein